MGAHDRFGRGGFPSKREHSSMTWSPQQVAALDSVSKWLREGGPQVFRLFGYAGTGKTTLARHIAEGGDRRPVFCAFTGKAALVMRAKGCTNARTIHSLIYRTTDSDSEAPAFVLNEESAAASAGLIVIDECSMVDEELGRDLLSFGRPVLVLGDPAQLPPIKGGGFFTEAEPDAMLTEVHRQAVDNPIVRLSMSVRSGEPIEPGCYGDSQILRREAIDSGLVAGADQILVGLNRTRKRYNRRLREIFGRLAPTPEVGDKLVCLRNDRKKGLMNGSLWVVKTTAPIRRNKLRMSVCPEEDQGSKPVRVGILPQFFLSDEEIPYSLRKDSDEFDYGYALTVHKAQGSQWSHVVVFDESFAFREHRSRWLYTAITRAAERLTVVI